ncbi:phenylacetate--CoA ligase family protein [Saccharicrinis sp. FJH2]|uniref:phenylacetate--CoA ligase family protein n=1 Tax=Saccharicrinis sp. FJH65 TaxID=3344659 RepID=UPI0035F287FF
MTIYNFFSKLFVLPVSDKITGWNVASSLNFLKKSQYWSTKEIVEYQEKKLIDLINFSYENIPYYKNLFDQHNINPDSILKLSDLNKIPLLTKQQLVENFNSGSFGERKSKYLFNQSSGSTGLKTRYYITPYAYGFNLATNLRGWDWMGYSIGDKMIKVTQNKRKSKLKKYQDLINRTKLFATEYSDLSTIEFENLLYKYKPDYLRCYPDPLQYFANKLKNLDVEKIKLKGINTTGNILFPEVRELIENKFECEIFDSYSCDNGPNVFECPTHNCYHVSEEQGICEVIDDNGSILSREGDVGRLIITNLVNTATPFIRYDTMDYVEIGPEKCECGRNLKTFKRIIGRNNDIIITPSGEMLIAQTFTTYFKYVEGIEQFQVIQDKKDHILFRLVSAKLISKNIQNDIISHWENKTMHSIKFDIEQVNQIEPLQSGKFRFVVRDPSIEITF